MSTYDSSRRLRHSLNVPQREFSPGEGPVSAETTSDSAHSDGAEDKDASSKAPGASGPRSFEWPYRTRIRVREHEIDSYGHSNYAVYLNWTEHARWEMVQSLDIDLSHGGTRTYARHLEMEYISETKCGDTVEIVLWPRSVGRTSFVMGSAIWIPEAIDPERSGTIAQLARTVLVCVRGDEGKVAVPADWMSLFPKEDPGPNPDFVGYKGSVRVR